MADVTRMDKTWLQNFITTDIEPFIAAIDTMQNVDDPVPTLATILGGAVTDTTRPENKPLAIGKMAVDDSVEGKALNDGVIKAAQAIITVLEDQKELFGDIQDDINETINTLITAQNDNLASIGGDEFLDIFSDVDDIFSGSSGSKDDS